MTVIRLPTRALLAIAWAVIGVLGGHVLTYALLFPDHHEHEEVLAESGHTWLALVPPLILVAASVAVVLGLLAGTGHARARGVRFAALAAIQVVLFGGMEIAERVTSGMTIDALPHVLVEHQLAAILVVGTLLQLVTAWLGSVVSRAVADVARRLARVRHMARRASHRPLPVIELLPSLRAVRAHRSRAPPGLALAIPVGRA
jgi:Zn-dependent protease with chaperone function